MNLPNKLTLTRIFMIPVFVLFFYLDVLPYHEIYAAVVFVLAACTDFLDGYIARKYHLVTNMGKFLDPIADKVLVSTAFILLLTRPLIFGYNTLAGWGPMVAGICVALIMARELIGDVFGYEELGAIAGFALLLLATVLTVISGVNYLVKNRQVLKEEKGE